MDLLNVCNSLKLLESKNNSRNGVNNSRLRKKILNKNSVKLHKSKGIEQLIKIEKINSSKEDIDFNLKIVAEDPIVKESYTLNSEIDIKDEDIEYVGFKSSDKINTKNIIEVGNNSIHKIIENLNKDLQKISALESHQKHIDKKNGTKITQTKGLKVINSKTLAEENFKAKTNNLNVQSTCKINNLDILSSTTSLQSQNVSSNDTVPLLKVNNNKELIKLYCSKCDKTFMRTRLMRINKTKEVKKKTNITHCLRCNTQLLFQCTKCKTNSKWFVSIYEHVLTVCENQNTMDKKEFKSYKYLKRHKNICNSIKLLKCLFCTFQTLCKNNYNKHLETHRKGNDSKKITSDENTAVTEDKVIKSKDKVIDVVGNNTPTSVQILNPQLNADSKKGLKFYRKMDYWCKTCEVKETFSIKVIGKVHCPKCTKPMLLKCKICEKLYISYRGFHHHIKTCSIEKSFVCAYCKRRYKLKYYLRNHIFSKHMKHLKKNICKKPVSIQNQSE